MLSNIIKIIFLLIVETIQEEKIIFAFQMISNGARSPNSGVNNEFDLFKEKWFGNNELSIMGKRQLYLSGIKAKKRYINKLLHEIYNPNEIYIKSTDNNHTIESIYSFLQGLYSSGNGPNISENITNKKEIIFPPNIKYKESFDEILKKYQMENSTIALPYNISVQPVHLFNKYNHEFQLSNENICKGFKEQFEKNKERKELKDFIGSLNDDIKNFFKQLENNENIDILNNYNNLYKYSDTFISDYFDMRNFNNLKKDIMMNNNLEDVLYKSLHEFLSEEFILKYNSSEVYLVDSSQTFQNIIYWMEQSINNYSKNEKYIKYVLYSSDDSSIGTLDGFINSLFGIKMNYSTFAESRIFELYIDENNKYKVRYSRGNNDIELGKEFNEFKTTIENKIWNKEKIDNFCQFGKENKENKTNIIEDKKIKINILGASIMIILSIIDGFLIALLILVCVQQKLKNKKNKTEVKE